jgi:hypothetical protein
MKLANVITFSLATQALFDANKPALVIFNPLLGGTFESLTWTGQMGAVSNMFSTGNLIKLNAGDTKTRNTFMRNLRPILKNLEFKIDICIANGTITDSLSSFGLAALRESINKYAISDFHLAYISLMGRIAAGGNTAALNTAGFLTANITSIKTNHDGAWNMSTTKIDLSLSIKSLSQSNQIIVNTLMATNMQVIKSMHAYAESISNAGLIKMTTKVAILSSVVPTPAKKPRNRHIAENTSICYQQNPVARDKMQFTLMTNGAEAFICRMPTKTGTCGLGIPLVYNEMTELKKADVPGTGDNIIITNNGSAKMVVKVFVVKG